MGDKQVTGRKRHLVVDADERLLAGWVTAADLGDRDAGRHLLEEVCEQFPTLRRIWAARGYTGDLVDAIGARCGVTVEIIGKLAGRKGFVPQPRRWVVERAFAWLSRPHRLSKDYEQLPLAAEAFLYLASIRVLLRRLAP